MALTLSLRGLGLGCRHYGVESVDTNHLDAEFGDLLGQWESGPRHARGRGRNDE